MHRWIFLALLVGLAGGVAVPLFLDARRRPGVLKRSPMAAPAFQLTERNGRQVGLNDLRGRVWVAGFIFTRCTGPCPMLTFRMSRLQKKFADAPNFRLVTFSVDPDHDSPDVLKEYADRYKADETRWMFLTGPLREVRRVLIDGFRIPIQPPVPGSDQVLHSTRLVLVNRDGRIIGQYNGMKEREFNRLERDIQRLCS